MQHAIETTNLRKTYKGGVEALKGVSLTVPRGCCFGLLGPNGAGKSTLIKTLLSIVRPSAGSAQLLGMDIGSAAARQRIGYLPEGHSFPQYLTARGVCEYFGRLGGLSGEDLTRQIDEKLDLVGLTQWADTKVSKFSKGMAQRVGVAQALIGDPELLFLDEPTDGVDPVGRAGLHFVLRKVTENGATVFINSHLLSELEELCDEVAILHRGTIATQGTVASITQAIAGSGVTLRVRTGDIPATLWNELEQGGATTRPGDQFEIVLDDEDDIPPLIDKLRDAGVSIYALEPKRVRLEEAFIKIIADKGETTQVEA